MFRAHLRLLAEAGCYILFAGLAESMVQLLRPPWREAAQVTYPIAFILGLRLWAGRPWRLRELGFSWPRRESLVEGLWLASLYTAYFLGAFLLLARFHYYYLLDFLDRTNRALTGQASAYEAFLAAVFVHALIRFAWQGELFCHGYTQQLAGMTLSPSAGVTTGWLISGAYIALEATSVAAGSAENLWLWIAVILLPGPLTESFYLRYPSLMPLIVIRLASVFTAFALVAFFAYWYPARSFEVAMPVFWAALALLALLTASRARRVSELYRTAWQSLKTGGLPGGLSALVMLILLLGNAWVPSAWIRAATALALAAYVRVSRKENAF